MSAQVCGRNVGGDMRLCNRDLMEREGSFPEEVLFGLNGVMGGGRSSRQREQPVQRS